MFPLVLLLPCVLLLLRGRGGRVPQWLLVAAAPASSSGSRRSATSSTGSSCPPLLWLVLAERGARLPRLGAFAVGSAVGLLPLVLGLLLLRDEVGGTRELLDWLRDNREGLDPGQDDQGVLGRVEVVWRESRYVFAGQWPWAMILQESRTAALEGLKATLLVVLPVVALLAVVSRTRAGGGWSACPSRSPRRSASARCSSAAGSTATTTRPCCRSSTPRSARLRGHPAARRRRPGARRLGAGGGAHRGRRRGRGDRRREQPRRRRATSRTGSPRPAASASTPTRSTASRGTSTTSAPGAAVHAPDWGLAMPVSYLLGPAFPVRMGVDAAALRAEACAGKPQLVRSWGRTTGRSSTRWPT